MGLYMTSRIGTDVQIITQALDHNGDGMVFYSDKEQITDDAYYYAEHELMIPSLSEKERDSRFKRFANQHFCLFDPETKEIYKMQGDSFTGDLLSLVQTATYVSADINFKYFSSQKRRRTIANGNR